jgi:hypothetical protein
MGRVSCLGEESAKLADGIRMMDRPGHVFVILAAIPGWRPGQANAAADWPLCWHFQLPLAPRLHLFWTGICWKLAARLAGSALGRPLKGKNPNATGSRLEQASMPAMIGSDYSDAA